MDETDIQSALLVCPHCASVNRVPRTRLAQAPRCGRCKQAMFMGQAHEAGAELFDRSISRGSLPVLVDFWASWCGPCRAMAPAFTAAARKLEPGVRLLKLNTETEQAVAARYGIRSIPTMILFSGGREIARQSGAMDQRSIVGWTRQALGRG